MVVTARIAAVAVVAAIIGVMLVFVFWSCCVSVDWFGGFSSGWLFWLSSCGASVGGWFEGPVGVSVSCGVSLDWGGGPMNPSGYVVLISPVSAHISAATP